MIGVIVPRIDSAATALTLMGIDEVVKELNYELIMNIARLKSTKKIEIREMPNFYLFYEVQHEYR